WIQILKFNASLLNLDLGNYEQALKDLSSLKFDLDKSEEKNNFHKNLKTDVDLSIAMANQHIFEKNEKILAQNEKSPLEKFADENPKNTLCNLILANKHSKNPEKSLSFYENIFSYDKNNSFANIAAANLILSNRSPKNATNSDDKTINGTESSLKIYKNYLRRVLSNDGNVFGLISLGVILAKKGATKEALKFFLRYKDFDEAIPSLWENVGNCYAFQGAHGNAIVMYSKALSLLSKEGDDIETKVSKTNLEILLAREYYYSGSKSESKSLLENLIRKYDNLDKNNEKLIKNDVNAPKNLLEQNIYRAWYNLALLKEDSADEILMSPHKKRTVKKLENAILLIKGAKTIYEQNLDKILNFCPNFGDKEFIEKQKLSKKIKKCEQILSQMDQMLATMKLSAEEERIKIETSEMEYKKTKMEKAKMAKEMAKEKIEVLKRKNELARQSENRLKDIKQKWKQVEKEIKSSKKRKRGRNPKLAEQKSKKAKDVSDKEKNESEENMFKNYVEERSDGELDYIPTGERFDDHYIVDSDEEAPNIALEYYKSKNTTVTKKIIESDEE
ncbi:hypothetical protein MHBO_002180, partial [Bonamia ostreae]